MSSQFQKIEVQFHGRPLTIETGRMAKQAGGAALVTFGETVVLVTATASASPREGIDFFPLTCDYVEKTFAAGKIPGGFFKREGRQAEKEILTSRLIDRPDPSALPEGLQLRDADHRDGPVARPRERSRRGRRSLGASTALHAVRHSLPRPDRGGAHRPHRRQLRHQPDQLAAARQRHEHHRRRQPRRDRHGRGRRPHASPRRPSWTRSSRRTTPCSRSSTIQEELRRAVGKPKRTVTAPTTDSALGRRRARGRAPQAPRGARDARKARALRRAGRGP